MITFVLIEISVYLTEQVHQIHIQVVDGDEIEGTYFCLKNVPVLFVDKGNNSVDKLFLEP